MLELIIALSWYLEKFSDMAIEAALLVAALRLTGLPGLSSITVVQFAAVVLYCLIFGLVVNDYFKLAWG